MRSSLVSSVLRDIGGKAASSTKRTSHRICTPDETFARIEPLLAAAGITRIADVTGLDRMRIPVAVVVRPNSRGLSVSQGKGLDFMAAKVSGAMEALESFHAERIDHPVHFLRWSELAGADRAIDPGRLPRLRNSLFHSEKRLPWISALDLVSGRERLVPLELVTTDFTVPSLPGTGCFPRSSNGLASGNSFGEATVHALCELVERDAYALHLRYPDSASRVDLASVSDPVACSLIERVEKAGGHLALWDITSDIGIPVFWAIITGGESAATAAPAGGLGCHPSRDWACIRAITEAAQSRVTRLSGSRDDLTHRWFQRAGAPPVLGSENGKAALGTGSGFLGETIEDDLRWLIDRLVAHGFDSILAVDLSRPEFGIPIVRLVVPGLEHPSGDAAPGRRVSGHDA